jgi:aryl-alcohol dehydrogenase-like predicted oxidoreductase
MRYRLLGRTGLRVSEVFLGAMTFGEEQIGASPQEARRILELYGTFTSSTGPRQGTRINPRSLGARDRTVAQAVQEVADDLGASSAQVAIAWTRARSQAVHPILGARTAEQLKDTLGALDLTLPDDAVSRLESATDFTLGFPGDFLTQADAAVFGESSARLDGRRLP